MLNEAEPKNKNIEKNGILLDTALFASFVCVSFVFFSFTSSFASSLFVSLCRRSNERIDKKGWKSIVSLRGKQIILV